MQSFRQYDRAKPHELYCVLHVIQPLSHYNKFPAEISMNPQTEVERAMGNTMIQWLASDLYQKLTACLSRFKGSTSIRKIVAFACGSIAQNKECLATISLYQHCLILSLKQLLEIDCFVQDPAYSEIDRRVFSDLSITHLHDPQGFLEVDEFTIVVSICPNVPVRNIVSDITQPAVMIWDKLDADLDIGYVFS
jgi:hypothetical protein